MAGKIGVVAVNVRGTLLVEPLDDPSFMNMLYQDNPEDGRFLDKALGADSFNDINGKDKFRKMVRQTKEKHNILDELQPGVAELATAIQEKRGIVSKRNGYGLVILSGMPAKRGFEKLAKLGIGFKAAYRAKDGFFNRSNPPSFRQYRKMMQTRGATDGAFCADNVYREDNDESHEPKVYWTHVIKHALAAADDQAWGKALLCLPNDYHDGIPTGDGIYTFTTEDLECDGNIRGIVNFVYGNTNTK